MGIIKCIQPPPPLSPREKRQGLSTCGLSVRGGGEWEEERGGTSSLSVLLLKQSEVRPQVYFTIGKAIRGTKRGNWRRGRSWISHELTQKRRLVRSFSLSELELKWDRAPPPLRLSRFRNWTKACDDKRRRLIGEENCTILIEFRAFFDLFLSFQTPS